MLFTFFFLFLLIIFAASRRLINLLLLYYNSIRHCYRFKLIASGSGMLRSACIILHFYLLIVLLFWLFPVLMKSVLFFKRLFIRSSRGEFVYVLFGPIIPPPSSMRAMSFLKSSSVAADDGNDQNKCPENTVEDIISYQRSAGLFRGVLIGYCFSWIEFGSDCICL